MAQVAEAATNDHVVATMSSRHEALPNAKGRIARQSTPLGVVVRMNKAFE